MKNGSAVMLLDDDDDLRPALAQVISKMADCRVLPLPSVDDLMRADRCALGTKIAFLDINLGPNKPSGLDAYSWLRANGYSGKIYFFTGHAQSNPLVKAARCLGQVEVLTKPVSIGKMLLCVREAIEESRS